MKKFYQVICSKYRKFKNPKISYLLEKNIRINNILSIICKKGENENEKIFQAQESIQILEFQTREEEK